MSYPHIPFRDCTRNTHPPFYRRQACRDFDTPYVVLTSFISLAFMQAQKLAHSAARPLPTKPASWEPLFPSISTLCVNLWMTRLAQRNQITPIMCATFTQRKLVVDLFYRNQKSTLITLLTEWMLCSVLVTDSFPRTSITAFGLLISAEFLIVTVYFPCMLLTVPSGY